MNQPQPPPSGPSTERRLLVAAVVVIVLLVIGLAVSIATRPDETSTTTGTSSTTSTSASSSTSTTSTTPSSSSGSTTTLPDTPSDTSTAVWPVAASGTRYTDPVEAARGFAVDYAGFADPVVGAFKAGDSRSGEVDLRPTAQGPVTTVLVRQLSGSDTWWVLGSVTDALQPSAPSAGDQITTPVHVAGTSTAFEATFRVEVREDGRPVPLGTASVMGGSNGDMGPFSADVDFGQPTAQYGALVFVADSMADGRTLQLTVLRVRFS